MRVFVGNIAAAKEALTLTAASDVVFLQLPWTPGDVDQCIARCVGRVSDPHGATAHYLVLATSIEEEILALIDAKRKVVDAVTDGKSDGASVSVLGDLLVQLAKRGMERAQLREAA